MGFIDDFRAILLNLSARDVDSLHRNADTDLSRRALHHTLGNKGSQASPGDHDHDGNNSQKVSYENLAGSVASPDRIRLSSTSDASPSSTNHAFQVGPDNSNNLIIDNNEIMARNNGATSGMYIQTDGGNLGLGNSSSVVTVQGRLVAPGTGWVTTGISLSPGTSWTVNDYCLRKYNGHVVGSVLLTYSGGTITSDSQANVGDQVLVTFPSDWENKSGFDKHIPLVRSGLKTWWARANNGGNVDFTHASFPGQTLTSGEKLYLMVDWFNE